MSREITLPSGNTVKLRDPETLLKKDRDKALSFSNNGEGVMQAVAVQDGIIAVSVLEWSFDLIPPSIRPASLGELSIADYNVLLKETEGVLQILFPFGNQENQTDPKAPTANFNA